MASWICAISRNIVMHMRAHRGRAIVVGGSLSGLALAAALRRVGVRVTVIEQTWDEDRGGTGLGVDRQLLSVVTGVDAVDGAEVAPLPVIHAHRETSTWHQIHRWLRSVVGMMDGIEIREGTRVESVAQDGARATVSGPGLDESADIVVGADGYRSVVRRAVDPANPIAHYGGFVLWRGLVDEAWLGEDAFGGGRLPYADAARLVIYHVPGRHGETKRGSRRITFAWYDGSRTAWLRDHHFLTAENEVISSVPFEAIRGELELDLRRVARTRWDGGTAAVLVAALDRGVFFGTPLAQYLPARLANTSVALVGDAAHVSSPMVGAGLSNALRDCQALATAIDQQGGTIGAAGVAALSSYERMRLPANRAYVGESMLATTDLLRSVGIAGS
jgi:2-polyprenyl-6-methoxyphenol hydroxylase-like FAD-dependent oxidoreductase